jgi:hypothetical protein
VGFNITDQLLVRIFAFARDWKKMEYTETVHRLFIDLKKADYSVRRELLYSIFIEFGAPMKLVRLIKLCLNEMYNHKENIGMLINFN